MRFWESGLVLTGIWLGALLVVAEIIRGLVPPLARLGVPNAIVAGLLGLLLGSSGLGLLPLDVETLESIVYHGLALIFIALSLQTPEQGDSSGAAAMAIGVPFMLGVQALVGLGAILGLGFAMGHMHPGFGLILPMGFEQGPGQALSMGAAWEEGGMTDGGQVGLIVAALGFGWATVIGVPMVAWLKRRGLVTDRTGESSGDGATGPAAPKTAPGALDLLTRQVAIVAAVYGVTYAFIAGAASALSGMPGIAAMAWGFHFIFGALFALGARGLINRFAPADTLYDPELARISGLSVDVVTCAALAAIQIAVLQANLAPILLVTTLGGVITLIGCLWLAPKVFPEAPYEHAVVWFGMSTGTLPMGLALLRIVDPDLESPAPMSAVIGSAGAVPFAAPFLLGIVPFVVHGWGEGYPSSALIGMGILGLYLGLLGLGWLGIQKRHARAH